jgi:hypothetical protein
MDQVTLILSTLACELNCAIDWLQHQRKGPSEAGDVERARGASSTKDAARLLYTISPMSEKERETFGLSEAERRSLVRVDSAKVNIAPPSAEARWFRFVGAPLGNATALYPHGDEIPVAELWQPPNIWRELPMATINAILDEIEAGPVPGRRYSPAKQADDRDVCSAFRKHAPWLNDEQCYMVTKTWLNTGMLGSATYRDAVTRKEVKGLTVLKRPG